MKPARRAGGAEIESVEDYSPLYGRLKPGDRIISINGERPRDLIDYLFLKDQENLRLRVLADGRERTLRLRNFAGEGLGLTFASPVFDGVRTCCNNCVFCFVDRMPEGLRPSLYLKDDDYRLSVLQGNFITLNHLASADLERILSMHLSPLYVSLHATDPRLRDRMMGGHGSEKALRVLGRLIEADIEVHLQVVFCPGLNDGEQLCRTLDDILALYPAVSAGIVPVGLGGREEADGDVRPVGREDASRAIELVRRFQSQAVARHERRLFYAADEFYILAGEAFPPAEEYEDYPQLENGIGMARDLIDETAAALCEAERSGLAGPVAVLTGVLGRVVLEQALRLPDGRRIEGLDIRPVRSRLFGPTVTVTGLVTGEDILRELAGIPECGRVLLPAVMLREDEFLDSVNISRVREATQADVRVVGPGGAALVEALGLTEERN